MALRDVVQSVHQELISQLAGISIHTSFKALVWRMATHRAIDACRRLQRSGAPITNDLLDHAPLALGRILSLEQSHLVARIMAKVKAHCKELWQRAIAGESYQQMSEAMGFSEGALRVKMLRCRHQAHTLRLQLEKKDVTKTGVSRHNNKDGGHEL